MEFFFIIVAIFIFFSSVAKKKKQEEERRAAAERAAAQRRAQGDVNTPALQREIPRQQQVPVRNARFPEEFEGTYTNSAEGNMQIPWSSQVGRSNEGSDSEYTSNDKQTWGSLSGSAAERQIKLRDAPQSAAKAAYTSSFHTVKATSEDGHTHQETSMTGGTEKCAPFGAAVSQALPAVKISGYQLSFAPNSVVQGVLYSEILGKPKALRR